MSISATLDSRKLASVATAAGLLQCNPRTVRRMIDRGDLVAYRPSPGLLRVDLNELDAFMANPARRSGAKDELAKFIEAVVARAPELTEIQREEIVCALRPALTGLAGDHVSP